MRITVGAMAVRANASVDAGPVQDARAMQDSEGGKWGVHVLGQHGTQAFFSYEDCAKLENALATRQHAIDNAADFTGRGDPTQGVPSS